MGDKIGNKAKRKYKYPTKKMSPRKQSRKTRCKHATYIKKTRPAILAKNARQRFKEH